MIVSFAEIVLITFTVIPSAIVSFDSQKRFIIDGTPFFAHGLYTRFDNTATDWQRHVDAGLNTVLCYGGLRIDIAETYGLKGIMPANDYYQSAYPYGTISDYITGQINGGKSYSNYLGVYIGDEIGTMYNGADWADQINRNNVAHSADANHLTWAVMCGPPGWGTNTNIKTASDVLMYDDYPIGSSYQIKTVYDWGIEWQQANNRDRPLVAVIQGCPVVGSGGYREIAEDELRAMACCALACRVNGIMWYQYYDFSRDAGGTIHDDSWTTFQQRWAAFSKVTKEISQIIPVMLNGEEVIQPSGAPFIHRAISYNNIFYLIAANGIDSAAQSGDITIPITSWSLSDAAVLYGQATISKSSAALHVTLEPNTGAVITIGGATVVSAVKNVPSEKKYKTESGRRASGEIINLAGRIVRNASFIQRSSRIVESRSGFSGVFIIRANKNAGSRLYQKAIFTK
jgi:hypothetical protein